jgi:hypothetical protein
VTNGKQAQAKKIKKAGTGETVEAAAAHAWENARAAGAKPGKYVIEKIEIDAVNPIRGYIVTIIGPTS